MKIICYIFSASGFNQFGLYHDDCLYENDDVKEALRRLPGVCVHKIQLIFMTGWQKVKMCLQPGFTPKIASLGLSARSAQYF